VLLFLSAPAPPGPPKVTTLPPNFERTGKAAATGAAKSGLLERFWQLAWDTLTEWIGYIIALLMGALGWTAAKLAGAVITGEDQAQGAFNELSRVAMKDLFGVDVASGDMDRRAARAGRTRVAASIGGAVLDGLFQFSQAPGGGRLAPSKAGAERYLTTVTQLALEGWMMGFIAEFYSLGAIEKVADLDDAMAQVLGLPGVSSQVMAAPLSILVHQPFEWLLNKQFRPRLLTPRQWVRIIARDPSLAPEAREELARQGYSDTAIDALFTEEERTLSFEETEFAVSRGIWTEARAITELVQDGWTFDRAKLRLQIARLKRVETIRRQTAAEAVARYADRDIDGPTMVAILDKTRLPAEEIDEWRKLAAVRRESRFRDLSVSELARSVQAGLLSLADFRRELAELGYTVRDQQLLELLLLHDVRTREEAEKARRLIEADRVAEKELRDQERARKLKEAEERARVRELSLSDFQGLVERGLRTLDEYRAFLRDLKFSVDDADDLARFLAETIAEREQAELTREQIRATSAIKQLGVSELEQAARRGILTLDDYERALEQRGFAGPDRAIARDLLAREIAEEQAAQKKRADAEARAQIRRVSVADVERAVRLGLRSIDSFRALLGELGFPPGDVDLLATLTAEEIARDDAARKVRAQAVADAALRRISIEDLERAVRSGVRTVAQYRTELARLGYVADSQDALVRLLELEVAKDRAAAAAHKKAEERARVRRISLAELEAAVELGLVSVSAYQAALVREGFPVEDQAILVAMLTRQLDRGRQAAAVRAAAEAEMRARGIELRAIESRIRRGEASTEQLRQQMAAAGRSIDETDTVVRRLEREMAAERLARERRQAVSQELRRRRISLAQYERGVLAGLRTVEQYAEFLAGEGIIEEDIELLVGLLEARQSKGG